MTLHYGLESAFSISGPLSFFKYPPLLSLAPFLLRQTQEVNALRLHVGIRPRINDNLYDGDYSWRLINRLTDLRASRGLSEHQTKRDAVVPQKLISSQSPNVSFTKVEPQRGENEKRSS